MTRRGVNVLPWLGLRPGATVLALLTAASTAAHAVRAADTPPPVPAAVRLAHPPASNNDPAGALFDGRITALDLDAGRIVINGISFQLSEKRTQVFRQGLPAPASALRLGERVHYGVAGADPAQRVLTTVYAR